ncbi:uncharacterized protein [Pocillopora verrucosa]|uniref:uncharacterized protein isoform X2 n=1 Tax=Pocillopora verrucosa TaxID=203993 RepID=UPI00334152B2
MIRLTVLRKPTKKSLEKQVLSSKGRINKSAAPVDKEKLHEELQDLGTQCEKVIEERKQCHLEHKGSNDHVRKKTLFHTVAHRLEKQQEVNKESLHQLYWVRLQAQNEYIYKERDKKWIDIRQKGQCERDMESHAGHYP